MKFLLDAQLPPALAHWLKEAGHEATHVQDVGLRDANDAAIWQYAVDHDVTILTKDEDFAVRSKQSAKVPIIVWLRLGNTTNRVLREWLAPRLPGILQLITQGHRLVEVI